MKIISAADINGFIIGNAEDTEKGTGCTVIICEEGAVGGVDVRGGGPATRETDLLRSENTVNAVNAVVLSGGSAFGLEAASGVMRELADRKIGFNVGDDIFVPIVCGASLYDLPVGEKAFPDVSMGMQAVENAYAGSFSKGNHGAGTGATVGKLKGYDRAMKTGLGTFACGDGVVEVGAIAAVNAVGDIYNGAGNIIAGLRSEDGKTIYGTIKTLKTMVHDGIVPEEEPITFVNRADLDEALAAAAKQLKKQEAEAVKKAAESPEEPVEELAAEPSEEQLIPEEPAQVEFEYAPVDEFEEETPEAEAEEIPEESETEDFTEETSYDAYIPETVEEPAETEPQIEEQSTEQEDESAEEFIEEKSEEEAAAEEEEEEEETYIPESAAEPVVEEPFVEEPVAEEFAEDAADEVIEEADLETAEAEPETDEVVADATEAEPPAYVPEEVYIPVSVAYEPVAEFENETPEAEEPEEFPEETETFVEETADEVYIPETVVEPAETEPQIEEPTVDEQVDTVEEIIEEVSEEAYIPETEAESIVEEPAADEHPVEIDDEIEESATEEPIEEVVEDLVEEATEESYIPESAEEFTEETAEPAFVPEFLEEEEEEPPVLTREEMGYDIVFNTTISCLITNAALTKSQANKLASILHDAYARAIKPVHGTLDGDTVFVLATGKQQVNFDAFAALATDVMQYAIIDGAMSAESAYGLPAAKDMR